MPVETITSKIKDGPECTVAFDIDDTLEGAVQRYGEAVVFSRYRGSLVIDLQSFCRNQMKKDPSPSAQEIQVAVDGWSPGVKAKGRSPAEKIGALFNRLSEDEKLALLKEHGLV